MRGVVEGERRAAGTERQRKARSGASSGAERDRRVTGPSAKKRVLVVDDHVDARVVLEEFFGAHGYNVSVCKDGQEALALLSGIDFDVILLDLMMPNHDGHAFLRAMHRLPARLREVPVVVVSAIAPPLMRGVAAVFRKPAPLADLLAAVEKLTGGGPRGPSSPFA